MKSMPALHATFVAHPHSVGESYLAHARTAAGFGVAMMAGGAACLVHAAVPAFFTTTGSDTVRRLYRRMSGRHATPAAGAGPAAGFCYEI